MVSPILGAANPFTERGRITDPQRFIGRWRELSMLFERMEAHRPVLVAGPPGIGKSSLLTHVAQSAAVNLEDPELRSFYIDLSVLPSAEACYELVVRALQSRGATTAALEVALLEAEGPVLLCLDRAETAIAAGWGEHLLESLARIARHSATASGDPLALSETVLNPLLLVAAVDGSAPLLSEPFAVLNMGAISPTETRLLIDTYLEDTGVQFTPGELRELHTLSLGQPAYLQRAAFHLFNAKTRPDYDWRAAYLDEARERPVPGAPLPPAVFEGEPANVRASAYGDLGAAPGAPQVEQIRIEGLGGLLAAILPLVAALLAWQISGSWLLAGGVLVTGIVLVVVIERGRNRRET